MEVVLLLGAERDLQEAYNWVEDHRAASEHSFLEAIELRLEHLKRFPLLGPLYRGRYRRLLIPRYPFGIFYVVESNRVVVHMRFLICGKIPRRFVSALRIRACSKPK
jgi:toxin ParE1/3/4